MSIFSNSTIDLDSLSCLLEESESEESDEDDQVDDETFGDVDEDVSTMVPEWKTVLEKLKPFYEKKDMSIFLVCIPANKFILNRFLPSIKTLNIHATRVLREILCRSECELSVEPSLVEQVQIGPAKNQTNLTTLVEEINSFDNRSNLWLIAAIYTNKECEFYRSTNFPLSDSEQRSLIGSLTTIAFSEPHETESALMDLWMSTICRSFIEENRLVSKDDQFSSDYIRDQIEKCKRSDFQ